MIFKVRRKILLCQVVSSSRNAGRLWPNNYIVFYCLARGLLSASKRSDPIGFCYAVKFDCLIFNCFSALPRFDFENKFQNIETNVWIRCVLHIYLAYVKLCKNILLEWYNNMKMFDNINIKKRKAIVPYIIANVLLSEMNDLFK